MILEVVKAITSSQQGNAQNAPSSGAENDRHRMANEEATRKAEEAMRKSEEAMRKTEDLLRRLQDEAERTRSAEQQARRMEEQVEAMRRQQQQVEASHRQQLDSLRDDLRREREDRNSMSVQHTSVVEMLRSKLDATQKSADEALRAVEDKKVDRILERVEIFGEKVERRFDAWESMFEGRQGLGQRALPPSTSIGSNIASYRNVHFQSTGRGMNGGRSALEFQPASASGSGDRAELWTRKG